jgi:hypothetical protein
MRDKKWIFVFLCVCLLVASFVRLASHFHAARSVPAPRQIPQVQTEQQAENMLEEIAASTGVNAAFQYLKTSWGDRPIQAHVLAHLIGKIAYEQLGKNGIRICDPSFAFGCYHGFLAALVQDLGDRGIDIARTGCHALPHQGDVIACLHGIGHGVMEWKGEIHRAIARCEQFPLTERAYCFDGAYMDFDIDAMEYGDRTVTSTENPWSFCTGNRMPKNAQPMCIRNQTFLLISMGKTPQDVAVACASLPAELKEMCISSIGIYSADKKGRSAEMTERTCASFPAAKDVTDCEIYAAEEFVFENSDSIAQQLCASMTGTGNTMCLRMIAIKDISYGRNELIAH